MRFSLIQKEETNMYFYNPFIFAQVPIIPEILNDGNTAAWWDFTDQTKLIKDADDRVSSVHDLSTNSRALNQIYSSCMPIWSELGCSFDGVNDFMFAAFSLNQPTHIYAVLKQNTYVGNARIWDGYNFNTMGLYDDTETNSYVAYAGNAIINNQYILNKFQLIEATYASFYSKFEIDGKGSGVVNLGTRNPGGFTIACMGGGDFNTKIDVKEIIIRSISDNSMNALAICNYLKSKYSL